MSKSLDTILADMRGPEADREFVVRPFDNRWEAIVTIYDPPRTHRAVGHNAREALANALALAGEG